MKAWLIYYQENARYNEEYIQFYIEEGIKLGIMFKLILVEKLDFGVKKDALFIEYEGEFLDTPDFVISRAIYPLLSKQLEMMGIRVFNNSFVSEICNDKAKTYQYLSKTNIAMVDSRFYSNKMLNDVLKSLEAGKSYVIKAVDGHGGSQVFLYDKASQDKLSQDKSSGQYDIENIINGIGRSDIVVQPVVGQRHQDLRVYVIGNEVIGSVLRTAKEGFKSNFSLGGEVESYDLSDEEKIIIDKILSQFDFGLVGIDFIIGDNGELIFNEIEDVVGSRMLYKTSDINVVESYLLYILNKLSFYNL